MLYALRLGCLLSPTPIYTCKSENGADEIHQKNEEPYTHDMLLLTAGRIGLDLNS